MLRTRRSTRAAWAAVIAAMLLWTTAASADVIVLRNGQRIRGTIRRETQSGIIVRLKRNQEIHVAYAEIAEIRRGGEAVPLGDAARSQPSGLRDRQKEQELIRHYSKQLELAYRRLHPDVVRIPYEVRRVQCDPVRAAKRFGLPVAEAKSNRALEDMFELTLVCYKNKSTPAWRRTLLFYGESREGYIRAVSQDVDLANIYLEHPHMPQLLHLTRG